MKKIIVFLCLLISIPLFSVGYDFSLGASYRFGYQYSFYKFPGLYEQVTIPLSFTFYPADNDIFSFGFKNKLGYRTIIYGKDYSQQGNETSYGTFGYSYIPIYLAHADYYNPPTEHEIYENLSFMIKTGKSVKFFFDIGCTAEFSFLIISNGDFYVINQNKNFSYSDSFNYITPAIQTYFSIGPSIEAGIELINKPKTFSMNIGIPFEFLIPLNSIKYTEMKFEYDEKTDTSSIREEQYFSKSWFNFSFGLEFTFSFYTFKKIF